MTVFLESPLNFRTILTWSMMLYLAGVSAQLQAESQYHAWQKEADRYYAKGEYGTAYRKYLKLAKKGDSFSQYRVSFMNLQAQGVKSEDVVEAFAWSVLAAQNGHPELVKYRKAVSGMVPEDQRRKAERKIDYYMRRWGNIAIAQDAIVGARKQTRDCTGSRLGMRCDEVYAAQMPSFWSTNPGAGDGSDGGSAAPSGSVSAAQSGVGGGDGRDLAYYQSLRDQIATLNRYIEENSGKVEIGELELIDDEADAANGSGQP